MWFYLYLNKVVYFWDKLIQFQIAFFLGTSCFGVRLPLMSLLSGLSRLSLAPQLHPSCGTAWGNFPYFLFLVLFWKISSKFWKFGVISLYTPRSVFWGIVDFRSGGPCSYVSTSCPFLKAFKLEVTGSSPFLVVSLELWASSWLALLSFCFILPLLWVFFPFLTSV